MTQLSDYRIHLIPLTCRWVCMRVLHWCMLVCLLCVCICFVCLKGCS